MTNFFSCQQTKHLHINKTYPLEVTLFQQKTYTTRQRPATRAIQIGQTAEFTREIIGAICHRLQIVISCARSVHGIKSIIMPVYAIYLPTKCTFLISTNIKLASPICFGTCVQSAGRTKCQFSKNHMLLRSCYL